MIYICQAHDIYYHRSHKNDTYSDAMSQSHMLQTKTHTFRWDASVGRIKDNEDIKSLWFLHSD